MDRQERLSTIVGEQLDRLGFELVKLDFSSRGKKGVVRIFIDLPGGEVKLDDCVKVTKALGLVLDEEDIMNGPFNLEVSSPGMNRPLSKPEHFVRFIGREARVDYSVGSGEKKSIIGIIGDADSDQVTISAPGGDICIRMMDILKANLHGEKWGVGKKKEIKKRNK